MIQIPRQKELDDFVLRGDFIGEHTPNVVGAALVVLSVYQYDFHVQFPFQFLLEPIAEEDTKTTAVGR
ncbi:hypothetical protein SDC9_165968 [bioreactor metagenome]|uniref:Uncharacterized protein n=1 Tax=bioreactor metagenome TaxID=1076179 RepID=A0A645FVR7_9ZZZZ